MYDIYISVHDKEKEKSFKNLAKNLKCLHLFWCNHQVKCNIFLKPSNMYAHLNQKMF